MFRKTLDMDCRETIKMSILICMWLLNCQRGKDTVTPVEETISSGDQIQETSQQHARIPIHVLWVGTECEEDEDCSGRRIVVKSRNQSITNITGQSGVGRFVLEQPEGEEIEVSWQDPIGEVKPHKIILGRDGEFIVTMLKVRKTTTQAESGVKNTIKSGYTSGIPRKTKMVESMTSTKDIPMVSYAGVSHGDQYRDVVVFTSFPGSYLYVDGKRYGEVGENGLVIKNMPLGSYRFVARMPPNVSDYKAPVSEVREIVKGKGAQVIRLVFGGQTDQIAGMLKKVEEGGNLGHSDITFLTSIKEDDPRYGDAASVLVTYYEKKKSYHEALRVLTQMSNTSRYGGDPEVYFHIAKIKTITQDLDGAMQSLENMERYLNQYPASQRNQKMAEMYKLRAKLYSLLYARSRGTKPSYLESSNRDWQAYITLTTSEPEKKKALEEIRKNEQRLQRTSQ